MDGHNSFAGKDRLARGLDNKFYPVEIYPFTLIYFTGDDIFNRALRNYCRKHGLSLTDDGLY